jgi:hypothetical protein
VEFARLVRPVGELHLARDPVQQTLDVRARQLQHPDRDDGDQGDDQRVLNQGLTLLPRHGPSRVECADKDTSESNWADATNRGIDPNAVKLENFQTRFCIELNAIPAARECAPFGSPRELGPGRSQRARAFGSPSRLRPAGSGIWVVL